MKAARNDLLEELTEKEVGHSQRGSFEIHEPGGYSQMVKALQAVVARWQRIGLAAAKAPDRFILKN